MKKILNWTRENWLVLVILFVGAFLRFYKIDGYMTFLGDEGRDAIIVRRLLVYADPILIGPGTSIGGMYLGPLYYYLIAPALLLAGLSPVGPSIFIAIIGVVTIYFTYYIGKKWFSRNVGLTAAILFAVSPTAIIYSRSSWNPNIMPFFALLSIYAIWKVYKQKEHKWLLVLGVALAFVMQSHYLGLLIIPTLVVFWYLSFSKENKPLIRYSIWGVLLFLFLMSPLAIFDVRHNYINSKALYKFFTVRQETVSIKPWNSLSKIYPIYQDMNTSLIMAKQKEIGKIATFLISLFVIFKLLRLKNLESKSEFVLLVSWLSFGLIGLGLYKQHVYDHYYGFIFPAIFLLSALAISSLISNRQRMIKLLGIFVLAGLVYLNIKYSPINYAPNMQMARSEKVAQKIIEESKGERYNLAVLAERNYEDGYQYFLEKENSPIVEIDSQIKESITDQLFVVCEMPKEKCDPTHSPKAEVANFGWSKVDGEWEVMGVTIYKLIHTK